MFLATTALVDHWDKDDDILVLGPWCLRYDRRREWERFKYSVLPNPWATNSAVLQAEAYCDKVISTLVKCLAEHLNTFHGVRFGQRYWRILLGPWLLFYVHALYERYAMIKCAVEAHHGLRTIALRESSYQTPSDTMHFTVLSQKDWADVFNLQLYSQVLRALKCDVVICRELNSPTAEPTDKSTSVWWGGDGHQAKSLAKGILMVTIPRMARVFRPAMIGGSGVCLNGWQWVRFALAMSLRGMALPSPQVVSPRGWKSDVAMRKQLLEIPASDEFSSLLVQTLPQNFPKVYMEGYQGFREDCLRLWPSLPKLLMSSTGWYFDDTFKFLAAEFGERGSRLVGLQNGGGYGTCKVVPPEKLEVAIVDRWLSLGWRSQQSNDNIQPLPQPQFLPLPVENASRRQSKSDILLVTTSHPRYTYRFQSFPVGGFHTVLEWRIQFIQALPCTCRDHLVVKLYGEDYGWCQSQRITDRCGPVRFQRDQGGVRQALRRARLAVIEYCGTPYLEALAANVPTVLFWDAQCWEMREEAEPYFENLRRAGILCDSPETAAAKVAAIYENPWAWWGSDAVQEARRCFVNRYALGRKDWADCWVKVLEEEMALSQVKDNLFSETP